MTISITPDQMAAAGSYISRTWSGPGYRIAAVESPTYAVTVFRVVALDGSRFAVAADKWGNCRHLDTHDSDAYLPALVRDMHAQAVAP